MDKSVTTPSAGHNIAIRSGIAANCAV